MAGESFWGRGRSPVVFGPMTRVTGITVLALAVLCGEAQATEVGTSRRIGIGIQLIDPTAIVGKVFIGHGNAIDGGLGFGSVGYVRCRGPNNRYDYCDSFGHFWSLHADYLWQDNLVRQGGLTLDWHIGAGGRIIFDNTSDRGYVDLIARMPLGLDFTFAKPSFLEAYVEIAPGLVIVPPLWFDIDAALGVRLYF
jgi:hypothetical protein